MKRRDIASRPGAKESAQKDGRTLRKQRDQQGRPNPAPFAYPGAAWARTREDGKEGER